MRAIAKWSGMLLLGFLLGTPVFGAYDGIYRSDDGTMNAVVQTYTDRSALIVLTSDLSKWHFFNDTDYVNAVSVPDLAGNGYHLDWNFVTETKSQAALKSPDGVIVRWEMDRVFSAPADTSGTTPAGEGWYAPADNSVNIVYQTYTSGFEIVIVSKDFSSSYVFLDPGLYAGLDIGDLGGLGARLTLSLVSENQVLARMFRPDRTQTTWLANRTHRSPGETLQLAILGCDSLAGKLDASCTTLADRFTCESSCTFYTEKLFGNDIRFCLGNVDCVQSISNCETDNGWIRFEVGVFYPDQCVPELRAGCCFSYENPLLLEDQPSTDTSAGVRTFFVTLPDDGF
ncbi:MAG: hypothetical protein HY788_03955 [Deltaproteobacteria bacterium]|nr:hypothetical protein [Deltaproteobacteria bacterium]